MTAKLEDNYCKSEKLTVLVNGFTVNRTSLEIGLVVADVVVDPPLVRVPPFSFGEPCGSSSVIAKLNVVGPFAKPLTRRK